jgi:hypothetical protein
VEKEMNTKQVVADLSALHALLKTGWTQRAMARDEKGYVARTLNTASCWCILGGAHKLTGSYTKRNAELVNAIRSHPIIQAYNKPMLGYISGIVDYNDAPDRTQDQVLRLIEETTTMVKEGKINGN